MLSSYATILFVGLFLGWLTTELKAMMKKPKCSPVELEFHPMKDGLKEPKMLVNNLTFYIQEDAVLAPSLKPGCSQRVHLGYRISIPYGYIGVMHMYPNSLLDSYDNPNAQATGEVSVLQEGWSSELFIDINNKHLIEPAGIQAGGRIALLNLVKIQKATPVPLIKEYK